MSIVQWVGKLYQQPQAATKTVFIQSCFEAANQSMQRLYVSKEMFLFGFGKGTRAISCAMPCCVCTVLFRAYMHVCVYVHDSVYLYTQLGKRWWYSILQMYANTLSSCSTLSALCESKARYTIFHFPRCVMSDLSLVFFDLYAVDFCTKGALTFVYPNWTRSRKKKVENIHPNRTDEKNCTKEFKQLVIIEYNVYRFSDGRKIGRYMRRLWKHEAQRKLNGCVYAECWRW